MRSRVICVFCALIGIGILKAMSDPARLAMIGRGGSTPEGSSPLRLLGTAVMAISRLSATAWRLDVACLIGAAILACLAAWLLIARLRDSAKSRCRSD